MLLIWPGWFQPVQQAIANRQSAARVGGELLGIDRVFARSLAAFEPRRIRRQGRSPEVAVLDQHFVPRPRPGSN